MVPLSLPNANPAAALRRKQCPPCREKREAQESGSVSHGGQEGNRSPPSTPAWRNSLRLLSPGARAVPSCRHALGRRASWEQRDCWSPRPGWLLSHQGPRALDSPEPQDRRRSFLTKDVCVCVCVCVFMLCRFSRVRLFATQGLHPGQASLSMGFPRLEHCNRLSFPSPGELLDPEIEPATLTSPSLAGGLFTTSATDIYD